MTLPILESFQIRGVPGLAHRTEFAGRRVDYWSPANPTHLIVAHDGQNIHDRRTATRRQTWQLAKNSIRVAQDLGQTPPVIIAVYHSSSKSDPYGRVKDLTPQRPFENGMKVLNVDENSAQLLRQSLRGDDYQALITREIIPAIATKVGLELSREKTAMLGSSMGGLATLYGVSLFPEIYGTALAFSPHWPIGGNPLVEALINGLPDPARLKLWMSRGTKGLDTSYQPFQEYADQLAQSRGWSDANFISRVYPRTTHSERSWASYVDQALYFWLT